MISVDEFQAQAHDWLAANRATAPRDYGAICPPDLVDARARRGSGASTPPGTPASTGRSSTAAAGLTPEHNAIWMLECALAGVPPVFNMVGLVLTGGALLRYGTPEQQAAPPRRHARRRRTCGASCSASPAPAATSAACRTKAERDGDRFVVNGQKVWCSGGRYSNWGILMARTEPRGAEARGHLVLPVPDGPARRRDPTAEADDRRGRVRRGVLHRRRAARRPPARPAARRLGRRHGGAHQRARPHRHQRHRSRTSPRVDGEAGRGPRPRPRRAAAA